MEKVLSRYSLHNRITPKSSWLTKASGFKANLMAMESTLMRKEPSI